MKRFRSVYAILALALILVTAGCGDDGKKDAENKKKVEDQLAKLPGTHNATVMVKGDTLTITNFMADVPYAGMGTMHLSAAEIKAEGVDFDADTKTGVVLIAKKTTYKDYKSSMTLSGESAAGLGEGTVASSVKQVVINDLQMDAAALEKALNKPNASIADLVPSFMTMKIGSTSAEGYRADFNMGIISGTMLMDKCSTGSMTMLDYNDLTMENFKIVAMGAELFSIGKWNIKKVVLPDFITPYIKHLGTPEAANAAPMATPDAFGDDLAAAFKKTGLRMEGMLIENASLRPLTNDPITLRKATVDLVITPDRISLKKEVDGFVIPPSVYGKGFEGKALATLYGKPFDFSGAVDFEAVKEGAGGRMTLNTLRIADKNLGGGEFSAKGTFAESDKDVPAVPNAPDSVNLTGMTFSMKDSGMVDLIFACLAEEQKAYNPSVSKEALKAQSIEAIKMQGMAGGAMKQVADALAQFLETPGSTFSFSIAPSAPMAMDALQQALATSIEGLNLKVQTTPGTK